MRTAVRRRDAGETLVEILMAVAIMGICFAAVLAGIATSVRTSAIHRESVFAENYARAIAESIQSQPFIGCANTYSTAGVIPGGSTFSVAPAVVTYWNRVTDTFGPTCVDAALDELQQVTVRVVPPDDRAATSALVVLKRGV